MSASVRRALVVRFDDGHTEQVPLTDADTFAVAGRTYAFGGIRELDLTTPELAALEEDAFGDLDTGRPVAEWGKT